jgi:hypothetical protein
MVGKLALERLLDAQPGPRVREPLADQPRRRALRERVDALADEVRLRIAVQRDVIDVGEAGAGRLQAVADGLGGKAGPVLQAAEPLLLRSRDELAVDDEACRRVGVIRVEAED